MKKIDCLSKNHINSCEVSLENLRGKVAIICEDQYIGQMKEVMDKFSDASIDLYGISEKNTIHDIFSPWDYNSVICFCNDKNATTAADICKKYATPCFSANIQ